MLIYASYGIDLKLRRRHLHSLTEGIGIRTATLEHTDKHKSLFAVEHVPANRFPECGRIPEHVEIVILNLERQPKLHPVLIYQAAVFFRCSGRYCTDACRSTEKSTRLLLNHIEILFHRNLITCLEVHIKALAFIDRHRHGIEHIKHTAQPAVIDIHHKLRCKREHRVS